MIPVHGCMARFYHSVSEVRRIFVCNISLGDKRRYVLANRTLFSNAIYHDIFK